MHRLAKFSVFKMQAVFYSFLLFISNYGNVDSATNDEAVPKSFGDEYFCNVNMLENDTNKLHCTEGISDLTKLNGKCPFDESDGSVMDPYISCPGYMQIPPPHEIIFSSGEIPGPEVQCRKCDLRLTPDNKAVIVECFQCFDIPSPNRPANRTERNILYKTYFLQIANYTSVEVTGQEYIYI